MDRSWGRIERHMFKEQKEGQCVWYLINQRNKEGDWVLFHVQEDTIGGF